MAEESSARQLLLVEGQDDYHVVRHLRDSQAGMPDFAICDKNGFPNLKRAISPEIKVPGRIALGILADANTDFAARWKAIRDHVGQADVDLPADATPTGTVVEGTPRVGVWLMPDNSSAGELEDFIERLMPAGDPVWPRARCYIDNIPPAERKFAANKVLRAQIHAWLAARANPRKMGAAIGAGDLNTTVALANQFVAWLRLLFS